ncbi:ribonuclease H-like domain-containing protein, partial [Cyathus striatus]
AESIAVDLEGVKLSREGRITIIQIFAEGSNIVWLVDVTTLGAQAFEHVDENGQSLQSVLESPDIMKAFYDVRCDSDALYNLYGLEMENVYDVQILEVAYRRSQNAKNVKYVMGLGKSVDTYLCMPWSWQRVKDAGRQLFAPELRGSYEVFEHRPLHPKFVKYCAQDVTILFDLLDVLQDRMSNVYYARGWDRRIRAASAARSNLAKGPIYRGSGNKGNRAIAPSF